MRNLDANCEDSKTMDGDKKYKKSDWRIVPRKALAMNREANKSGASP